MFFPSHFFFFFSHLFFVHPTRSPGNFFYIYHATDTTGFGSKFYKEMERMHIVALDSFVSSPGTYWSDLRFSVKSDYCYIRGQLDNRPNPAHVCTGNV